jgi:hypothetical protein
MEAIKTITAKVRKVSKMPIMNGCQAPQKDICPRGVDI